MGERSFEKYYPFITPIIILALYYLYAKETPDNLIIRKLPEWLNISLTLSGISLGFIGTMIGAILSVVNSKIMRLIYSQNADHLLMSYIRAAALANLVVLLLSIVLLVTSNPPSVTPPWWFIYPWLFSFCCSLLCSYRIIQLLFSLLVAVNNENRANYQSRRTYVPNRENLRPPNCDHTDDE